MLSRENNVLSIPPTDDNESNNESIADDLVYFFFWRRERNRFQIELFIDKWTQRLFCCSEGNRSQDVSNFCILLIFVSPFFSLFLIIDEKSSFFVYVDMNKSAVPFLFFIVKTYVQRMPWRNFFQVFVVNIFFQYS